MELNIIRTLYFEFLRSLHFTVFAHGFHCAFKRFLYSKGSFAGPSSPFLAVCLLVVNHSAILTCLKHAPGNLWLLKDQIKAGGDTKKTHTHVTVLLKCEMLYGWFLNGWPFAISPSSLMISNLLTCWKDKFEQLVCWLPCRGLCSSSSQALPGNLLGLVQEENSYVMPKL